MVLGIALGIPGCEVGEGGAQEFRSGFGLWYTISNQDVGRRSPRWVNNSKWEWRRLQAALPEWVPGPGIIAGMDTARRDSVQKITSQRLTFQATRRPVQLYLRGHERELP